MSFLYSAAVATKIADYKIWVGGLHHGVHNCLAYCVTLRMPPDALCGILDELQVGDREPVIPQRKLSVVTSS